jgi:hypothetical protein
VRAGDDDTELRGENRGGNVLTVDDCFDRQGGGVRTTSSNLLYAHGTRGRNGLVSVVVRSAERHQRQWRVSHCAGTSRGGTGWARGVDVVIPSHDPHLVR